MRVVHDILHATGLSVWIDEGLAPGTPSWTAAIQEDIQQATAFVVLRSPARPGFHINRFVATCQADGRVVAAFLGGVHNLQAA
jgi:hypothetical protein